MKMNYRLISGSVLSAALFSAAGMYAADRERPNVLLFILDDAGYNDFGFMGCTDLRTPNIDTLASAGIVFSDAHVTASVSGPSRCGILTGRYQQRNGYECNLGSEFGMGLDEETFAEIFKRNGYDTACIGKWHQGNGAEYHPNKRGFDHFFGFISGSRSYFYDPDGADKPGNTHNLQCNGTQVVFDGYMTDVLADEAAKYIREQSRKESPFFMYLAFNAVHTPMQATADDLALFEGHPRQKLAAMTWAVDRGIGTVVKALKDAGEFDDTIIFFISDNGGAHNNQSRNTPLKGFKGNKYEGGHRVPFFVLYGDMYHGKYEGLTSSLDILPTAMDAAGIDMSDTKNPLDGVSLLPFISGLSDAEPHDKLFWRKDGMAAARVGDYKYIRARGVGERLYNLESNPEEDHDLCGEKPEVLDIMRDEMEKWESGLVYPLLWDEGEWKAVTEDTHRCLMNNREPQILSPDVYRKKQRERQSAVMQTFLPGQVWKDTDGVHINAHGGGVLYHAGKYYFYGEHKSDNTSSAMVGVNVYSSKDLYNWDKLGVALSVMPEGSGHKLEKGCIIERPKVIYNKKTGNFVMWFHLEYKDQGYKTAEYGVAVSESPEGPFRFLYSQRSCPGKWPVNMTGRQIRTAKRVMSSSADKQFSQKDIIDGVLVARDFEKGQMSRDMTLFIDDDGTAYHIFSSEENKTIHIAKLTDDYLYHSGEYVRILPGESNEAPAVFKKDGKYWMITSGCTGWAPNAARLSSSDSIFGKWKSHPNPCTGPEAETTFGGQGTYILPVNGKNLFIFMADIWKPRNPIDARYVWLPISFSEEGVPILEWKDKWSIQDIPE